VIDEKFKGVDLVNSEKISAQNVRKFFEKVIHFLQNINKSIGVR
jgi:hypothetical protein